MSALLHRRELVAVALALFGGAAIMAGCGGGSSSPTSPAPTATSPAPTPTSSGDVFGVVADNHPDPHVAVITAAQLSAGAALTLTLSNSRHSHSLALSAAQLTQIAAHTRVSV